MNLTEVIAKLIHLPREFKMRGNVSIFSLLKESGYFEVHNLISPEEIRSALAIEPEYVDEWLAYSEDKRTSQGWYFLRDEGGGYVVGYFNSLSGDKLRTKYVDQLEACTNFIKKEVDTIRKFEETSDQNGR